MVAAAPTTIASPRPARRTSRRLPSRNATASCIGKRDSGYGISSGSTNEIPAAKRKNAAGPANGNHRRANTGSTRIASAGRQNHSVVVGAPDEPRPSTTSSIATIASSAISRSNQYMRARCSTPLTHRTYPTSSRTTSHKVRPGIPLKYYPPPNRQPGDDAAPATPRPNGAHTLADDAHTAHHRRAHAAHRNVHVTSLIGGWLKVGGAANTKAVGVIRPIRSATSSWPLLVHSRQRSPETPGP